MPSPFEPCAPTVEVEGDEEKYAKSLLVGLTCPLTRPPASARPPPPRKPKPVTLMTPPPRLRLPATSKATPPPEVPSHAGAVKVPESVALEYCGTRMTWKRRTPCAPAPAVEVAAAFV